MDLSGYISWLIPCLVTIVLLCFISAFQFYDSIYEKSKPGGFFEYKLTFFKISNCIFESKASGNKSKISNRTRVHIAYILCTYFFNAKATGQWHFAHKEPEKCKGTAHSQQNIQILPMRGEYKLWSLIQKT